MERMNVIQKAFLKFGGGVFIFCWVCSMGVTALIMMVFFSNILLLEFVLGGGLAFVSQYLSRVAKATSVGCNAPMFFLKGLFVSGLVFVLLMIAALAIVRFWPVHETAFFCSLFVSYISLMGVFVLEIHFLTTSVE